MFQKSSTRGEHANGRLRASFPWLGFFRKDWDPYPLPQAGEGT